MPYRSRSDIALRDIATGLTQVRQELAGPKFNINLDLPDAAFFAHHDSPLDRVPGTAALASLEPLENLWVVPFPHSNSATQDLFDAIDRDDVWEYRRGVTVTTTVGNIRAARIDGARASSTIHATRLNRQEAVYTLPNNDGHYLAVFVPESGVVFSRFSPHFSIGGREYRLYATHDGHSYEYYLFEYYFDTATFDDPPRYGGHSVWRYVTVFASVDYDAQNSLFHIAENVISGTATFLPAKDRISIVNLRTPYYGYPSRYII